MMSSIEKIPSVFKKLPVLVVGGGLGGFTAALSLHRTGIPNNIVISQSKFTQDSRNGIFLGGMALRILDRLGLGSQYRALGMPISNIILEDTHGKHIANFNLENTETQVWALPKPQLQQLFLEALPADSVHFATKFRNLTTRKNDIQVQVEHISDQLGLRRIKQNRIIDTRFVIGADGMNSTVRMFMSRPVMTISSGISIWRSIVRTRDVEQYPFHTYKEIWDRNRRFGYARISPEEVMWWAIASDFSEVVLRPFSPNLLRLFSRFPQQIPDLISSVASDRDVQRTSLKRVWAEKSPWIDDVSNRIALVGDSGRPGNHGNFHTGASLAIEDGYILSSYLADQNEKGRLEFGPYMGEYETNREESVSLMSLLTSRFDKLATSRSSIERHILKKLLNLSVNNIAVNRKTQAVFPVHRIE